MQVELANLKLALALAIHFAGIRTDDHRAQATLRQMLGQPQRVRATPSNGEPPREQQDERFDFGHGTCSAVVETVLVSHDVRMGTRFFHSLPQRLRLAQHFVQQDRLTDSSRVAQRGDERVWVVGSLPRFA